VQWKVRRGLSPAPSTPEAQKLEALQTGVRGETYAYWYLRRLGYIFIARNHMPEHAKGELDLIGFDGDTLALIVFSLGDAQFETLIRTAHYFLRERHIKECPLHFDVVAIDNTPGQPPVVRLHKSALSPVVHRHSDW
jgi:Holliday junction resolvase-like predicted endonuclease